MMSWKDVSKTQPKASQLLTSSMRRSRLSHAYVFQGPQGAKKEDTAMVFAMSLFCHHKTGVEPCGSCPDCKRVRSGNHPDLHVLSPDGASIKIDQIRALQKEFTYTSMEAGYKFYMIRQAHLLTVQAANSLLKFLEEPGQQTIAVLLTDRPSRLLDTIISRCQCISFQPVSMDALTAELVEAGAGALKAHLASALTQDVQAALRMTEEEWFATARNVVIQLEKAIADHSGEALAIVQEDWVPLAKDMENPSLLFDILLLWYRDLLMVHSGQTNRLFFPDQQECLERQSLRQSKAKTAAHVAVILETKRHLEANANMQLLVEQLVFRLQEG
ncbi:DNA polymerase III subunit delta' [Aureibacillus halotolerans]|uniref:DNA polymerase III subunit delta' n=1 Tax=Aureibacillus halotolerans TaxID=1508390 RepID=A0A4R6TTZ6_9BACI|nr:DNA polymerase III subunit delta' [Aureibacillus halotolerans]TDQ34250.1 DNA polymerase III delta prime subunit [Aureibacillus halotolerans]